MDGITGVLLVNLGTPDSPAIPDVRKYLKEFLLDERVIDIPALSRNLLVRGIIAPFRAPKSAKLYSKVWMDAGSPLIVYGKKLKDQLQQQLGDKYIVALAMRYQNPSIKNGLEMLRKSNCSKLIVVPLFPQYASASSGSVLEKVMQFASEWPAIPELHFTGSFYDHALFIKAFATIGQSYDPAQYDHILFSFHGLPERQIKKTSPLNNCLSDGCCDTIHPGNAFCYRAQCFKTAALIAEQLAIPKDKYTVCFQSRLGRTPWIKPYSDMVIAELAKGGKKKILAFSPSFVSDCLETLYEIGEEYDLMFKKLGGESIRLVQSLNDDAIWVSCLKDIITHTGA